MAWINPDMSQIGLRLNIVSWLIPSRSPPPSAIGLRHTRHILNIKVLTVSIKPSRTPSVKMIVAQRKTPIERQTQMQKQRCQHFYYQSILFNDTQLHLYMDEQSVVSINQVPSPKYPLRELTQWTFYYI